MKRGISQNLNEPPPALPKLRQEPVGSTRARPMPRLREYRGEYGGIETRVIEVDGDGPPVVLLHGFCDSADTWRSVLDRLRHLGRTGIAIDFPGFGYADDYDWTGGEGNLLDRQVDFAELVVRDAAARWGHDAVVAGNSLGGWTTLRLAERPLPLKGIVPVAPAGLTLSPWFFRLDSFPGLKKLLAMPTPVPDRLIRNAVARGLREVGFGQKRGTDEGFIKTFSFHNRTRAGWHRRIEMIGTALGEVENPFDHTKIQVPSVVVWGTRDLLCLPAGAEPLAEKLGGGLTMVDKCGHMPQVEAPDTVVEAIERLAPLVERRRKPRVPGR